MLFGWVCVSSLVICLMLYCYLCGWGCIGCLRSTYLFWFDLGFGLGLFGDFVCLGLLISAALL